MIGAMLTKSPSTVPAAATTSSSVVASATTTSYSGPSSDCSIEPGSGYPTQSVTTTRHKVLKELSISLTIIEAMIVAHRQMSTPLANYACLPGRVQAPDSPKAHCVADDCLRMTFGSPRQRVLRTAVDE